MISAMLLLIILSIVMGLLWVFVFLWCLKKDQYADLDGSSQRLLYDEDTPITETERIESNQHPSS